MIKLLDLEEHNIEFIKTEMDGMVIKISESTELHIWLDYNNLGRDNGQLLITGGHIHALGYDLELPNLESTDLPQFILDELITYEQNIDHYQQHWFKLSDEAKYERV